jgi:gas vesicle protein
LNEGLKKNCSGWLDLAKFFSNSDYNPHDARCTIFKDGYKVVLKQSQHKDTLADLAEFKLSIDIALEGLDDDKSRSATGEKLNEGMKLNAYNFLKEMNDQYIDLVISATMIELLPKCGNKVKKIRKHYQAYHEQVKSKLDKMVQKKKDKIEENKIRKLENEIRELEKVVEETDEDTVKVHYFEHKGTTYLHDKNTNILFDCETHDEVGVWNPETKTIDEIEDDEE